MLCRLHTVYKIIHCVALHTLCNITQSVSNHTVKWSIFRVTSRKNLHLPKKNYTGTARGARDKYQVCAPPHKPKMAKTLYGRSTSVRHHLREYACTRFSSASNNTGLLSRNCRKFKISEQASQQCTFSLLVQINFFYNRFVYLLYLDQFICLLKRNYYVLNIGNWNGFSF